MKILFGVFDWGLGHATRDIPLIEGLLKRKHTVDILTTGRALALLKKHFGDKCTYFDVPSVRSPYTKTRFFTLNFIRYTPHMIKSIQTARRLSLEIIQKGNYDKVISDCRYDVYDKVGNSYFINHQVRFLTFAGAQRIGEKWLAIQQRKYRYILVPDFEKENITGKLSHDLKSLDKDRVKYIGILSHLEKSNVKKDIDYFISISGPEPQRTLLEEKIFRHLGELSGRIVITLGQPERQHYNKSKDVEIFGFLGAEDQGKMMNRAKMIITRSGYTTMMELYELEANALLIPTPGQTEQEYLADLYEEQGQLHHVSQYKLDLAKDIAKARTFPGFKPVGKTKDSVLKFMEIIGA